MVRIDNFRKSLIRAIARHNLGLRAMGIETVNGYFDYIEMMETEDPIAFRQLGPLVVSNKDNFSCTSRFWMRALECEGFADVLLLTMMKIAEGKDRHIQFNDKNEGFVRDLLVEIKFLVTSNISSFYAQMMGRYGLESEMLDFDPEHHVCEDQDNFYPFAHDDASSRNSYMSTTSTTESSIRAELVCDLNEVVDFLGPCPKADKKKRRTESTAVQSHLMPDFDQSTCDFETPAQDPQNPQKWEAFNDFFSMQPMMDPCYGFEMTEKDGNMRQENDFYMVENQFHDVAESETPFPDFVQYSISDPSPFVPSDELEGIDFGVKEYQSSSMISPGIAGNRKVDPLDFILEEIEGGMKMQTG